MRTGFNYEKHCIPGRTRRDCNEIVTCNGVEVQFGNVSNKVRYQNVHSPRVVKSRMTANAKWVVQSMSK